MPDPVQREKGHLLNYRGINPVLKDSLRCRDMVEEIMDDEDEVRDLNLSSRPLREERRRLRERGRLERGMARSNLQNLEYGNGESISATVSGQRPMNSRSANSAKRHRQSEEIAPHYSHNDVDNRCPSIAQHCVKSTASSLLRRHVS